MTTYYFAPRMVPVRELDAYTQADLDAACEAIEQFGEDELERYLPPRYDSYTDAEVEAMERQFEDEELCWELWKDRLVVDANASDQGGSNDCLSSYPMPSK